MSMHRIPLTDIEREGLKAHGLGRDIGKPSQLADCFRQGVKWGQGQELSRLHAENTALQSGYDAARLEIASLQAKLAVFDSASAVRRDSTAQQGGAYPVDTGNPEANRIIGRLASSDPDFEDCVDAVALIHKLVAEHKGPAGFATWKDAAISERMRRVDAAIDAARAAQGGATT